MSELKKELSNLSYTNKDFGQIYTELLDLAKKISYKWDPSLSDESDPGVVLIKIAALMADKCNYNIDKNVLELFPLSVTQLANARQIFDQCGYTMKYYRSATTDIMLKMTNEPSINDDDVAALLPESSDLTANDIISDIDGSYIRHYTIPKFTMLSDVDNSVVYTTLESADVTSDGNSTIVEAIQGAVKEYSVNGSTTITVDMLDSNNRLYFTELNIPENGIFITNIDNTSSINEYWKQSDNLMIEEIGTKCYKFGLTTDGTRCFVEFPSDIDSLIGRGLTIHYIISSGIDGNIRSKFIHQLFTETEINRRVGNFNIEQAVKISSDNIYITNPSSALNGANPETIDDAYKNYQKIKTTFETLVSTRDYTNFLRTNKDLSNCVVCDRSNDIQSSYNVLNNIDGEYQLIPHVRESTVNHKIYDEDGNDTGTYYQTQEPELTAFDLRIYGLKYVDGIDDYSSFSKTFDLQPSVAYSSINDSTRDVKCLSHNYIEFLSDRIILLKNRYPIVAKIVSPYKLGVSQQAEILDNVKLNLFQVLNSKNIEFGEEIDYNLIYNTILTSDSRISAVILDDIKYETYALFLNSRSGKIESIRIDSNSKEPTATKGESAQDIAHLVSLWKKFRIDVYTSAILEGVTPLFPQDDMFIYSMSHEHASNGDSKYAITTMSTKVDIPISWSHSDTVMTSRVLKPNDVITITAPNLVMDKKYANYCQYVTNIGCYDVDGKNIRPNYDDNNNTIVVKQDAEYTLKQNEYIIFFWRTSDSTTEPYTYVKYTGRNSNSDNPTIICPSFDMVIQPNTTTLSIAGDSYSFEIDDDFFRSLGDTSVGNVEGKQLTIPETIFYSNSNPVGKTLTLNTLISKYFIGSKFNVSANSIETKKVNRIELTNADTGTKKFYWILNSKTSDNKYRLFSADSTDTEYILKDDEMLIYSNDKGSQLYVLGAGTKIERRLETRKNTAYTAWECPALEHKLEFMNEGPSYFENSDHPWFNISKRAAGFGLYATEMVYRKIGADTQLVITPPANSTLDNNNYFITSNGIENLVDDSENFHSELCSYSIINEFGEEEKLPDRTTTSLAWKITSSLNINMSYESPQRVYSNQVISWTPQGSSIVYSIEGSNSDEIFIQSDNTVAYSGGSNIDVRQYDILNEVYNPLNIYIYKIKSVDMSSDLEENNYDSMWTFTEDEILVSGKDISLSNVTLPEGNYLLPVKIENSIYSRPDVDCMKLTWIKLRDFMLNSQLSEEEKSIINNLQTEGSSADISNAYTDWHQARKPVKLCDVMKWVFGSANIDVSNIVKFYSVSTAFDSLFKIVDKNNLDPDAGTIEYERRTNKSDAKYDSNLDKMLVSYGGEDLNISQSLSSGYAFGDVICCRVIDSEGSSQYRIFVYSPKTGEETEESFLDVSSDGICRRSTREDILDILDNSSYYYTLRITNVSSLTTTSKASSTILQTVNDTIVDKDGTYYYLLSVDDDSRSYTLKITCECISDEDTYPSYTIYNPVKYTKPLLTSSGEEINFFDAILEEIAKRDPDNKFEYTYKVPEDVLISYPLDSIAFLDKNHPMNKFTICQYTISDSKKINDMIVSSKSR